MLSFLFLMSITFMTNLFHHNPPPFFILPCSRRQQLCPLCCEITSVYDQSLSELQKNSIL